MQKECNSYQYTLSASQLIANPYGVPLIYIGLLSVVSVYFVNALREHEASMLIFSLTLLAGLLCAVFVSIKRKIFLSKQEHVLIIKNNSDFEVMIQDKVISKHSLKTLKRSKDGNVVIYRGLMSCGVLGSSSGHTLLLPRSLLDDPRFKSFLNSYSNQLGDDI